MKKLSPKIKNEVISASAGSGKTYQLTNRYIFLLAQGVEVESIVALTFTKKAAEEIFVKVITKLLDWYYHYDLKDTQNELINAHLKNLDRLAIFRIIKKILLNQDKLQISTLDSFFVNILQNFPLEFGISGDFEIVDDFSALRNKEVVLRQILSTKCSIHEKKLFLEQFKRASYGKEIKNVRETLINFIDEYFYIYMLLNKEESWIIPGYSKEISIPNDTHITKVAEFLKQNLDKFLRKTETKVSVPNENQKNKIEKFLNEAVTFSSLSEFSKDAEDIFIDMLGGGYFLKDANSKLETLIEYLTKCIFTKYSYRTSGIYSILQQYDTVYDRLIRGSAQLSFADITYILNGRNNSNKLILSEAPIRDSDYKLYVDSRLDSRFDHWLIDEFQDTNKLQWNIIENLIDEAINQFEEKSFFYVGDVKQSIYAWRGGDPYLFDFVRRKYADNLYQRELNVSRRSSKEVIDTVNRVFTNLESTMIPSDTVLRWSLAWGKEKHATVKEDAGYSSLIELSKDDDVIRAVIEKIKEIDPISRGLSVGILVQKNKRGREFADELKKERIPVTLEGNFELTDSPAVTLLLSLIKFVQHPADTLSYNHLLFSPLKDYIEEKLTTGLEEFILEQLDDINKNGFAYFVDRWTSVLRANCILNEFDIGRLDTMIQTSRIFDAAGDKNCLNFLKYIESYKIVAEIKSSAIQVMTIHKSKGLEFDIVFIPDIKETKGNLLEHAIHEGINTINHPISNLPEYAMLMPKRAIALSNLHISELVRKLDKDHCYERLCCLYVAMTRAKRALYMYLPEVSCKSKTFYSSDLLRLTLLDSVNDQIIKIEDISLKILFEVGHEKWYECVLSKKKNKKVREFHTEKITLKNIKKNEKEAPSKQSSFENKISIASLFSADTTNESAKIGTCIHYMFERVKWLEDYEGDPIYGVYEVSLFEEKIWNIALEAFKKAINSDAFRQSLRKVDNNTEVWCEKSFSCLIDDHEWIVGCFDRVVILKDVNDNIVEAIIYDYKYESLSIEVDEIKKHYSNQMHAYKKALAFILDIPIDLIKTNLLLINRKISI